MSDFSVYLKNEKADLEEKLRVSRIRVQRAESTVGSQRAEMVVLKANLQGWRIRAQSVDSMFVTQQAGMDVLRAELGRLQAQNDCLSVNERAIERAEGSEIVEVWNTGTYHREFSSKPDDKSFLYSFTSEKELSAMGEQFVVRLLLESDEEIKNDAT